MPPSTRFIGKEIDAPDVVRAANLGSLNDLTNDWCMPVIAVAAGEKQALIRSGPPGRCVRAGNLELYTGLCGGLNPGYDNCWIEWGGGRTYPYDPDLHREEPAWAI
jgi:hypothetical protein